MGKKRGYKLGDRPDELQKAIDQIVEVKKDKEKRVSEMKVERQKAQGDHQKKLLAAVVMGVMLTSFVYSAVQMGWMRLGDPAALAEAMASPETANALKLDGERLETVPSEISSLSKLRVLTLDSNELKSLPPDLGKLSELQTLSVSYNELVDLPKEFATLGRLSVLKLKANRLTTVPSVVGTLAELKELELSNNRLGGLPPEIGNLKKLEILRLRGNPIPILPAELTNLHNLTELDLAGTQLSTLPDPKNFPRLRRLSLRGTKVDEATVASYEKTIPKVSIQR